MPAPGPNEKGLPEFAALEGLGSTRYLFFSGQLSPVANNDHPAAQHSPHVVHRPELSIHHVLHMLPTALSTKGIGDCQARV